MTFTKVSLNHATPSTQTQADKTGFECASINKLCCINFTEVSNSCRNNHHEAMIASFRPKITGLIRPIFLEIAVA